MRVLAIIPARGGSKGVPNKNIYPIDGKPLIHYTIESTLASKNLSKIIISSDANEILDTCSSFDVKLHYRAPNLASDSSPVIDTVISILENQEKEGIFFDAVMLLQPTSPIKTGKDIDTAIDILMNNSAIDSVISVVEMDDIHPARMYWKKEDNTLASILPEYEKFRRQDIPKALYRNGVIYLTRVSAIKREKQLMTKKSMPYIMPSKYMVNIDEPKDLLIAETLIKAWKEGVL